MSFLPDIAGNTHLLTELQQMRRQNHLPHALLLQGEKGCGKKMIAKWFSMLVLCEQEGNAPCGVCRNCRLIAENAHPDILSAQHSGKRMGYSVETIREIRKEVGILPNNGNMRIFIFSDADGMSVQAQNALLKSVEEPPAHACFVFTVESMGTLLPTLLSRMTAMNVFPVSPEESAAALQRLGFPEQDIQSAVARYEGNIGKCITYLSDETTRTNVETASELTLALASQNEYELLRLLSDAAADKDSLRQILLLTDAQIRDAAVLSLEGTFARLGCDKKAAETLSVRLTVRRTAKMHEAILQALENLESNVSAMLTATTLCSVLTEC
ncbi:MAG: hypothetical protein MJ071_09215 [Oscillospiraceae bacterium]|nr:hypothetical protein [Oscillospiraceae bacterium]